MIVTVKSKPWTLANANVSCDQNLFKYLCIVNVTLMLHYSCIESIYRRLYSKA